MVVIDFTTMRDVLDASIIDTGSPLRRLLLILPVACSSNLSITIARFVQHNEFAVQLENHSLVMSNLPSFKSISQSDSATSFESNKMCY